MSTILIVDDQPHNTELLEAFLSPHGFGLIKASTGAEALDILAAGRVDLMLLDVMMAGMDGFEVTRRVRHDGVNALLPIILVTALRGTEDRIKGIDAGCDDFISKPIDRLELLARVRSLLKVKAYNDLLADYRKNLEAMVAARTEELSRAVERLKASSLETIYRLSTASEFSDEDTGLHLKRMSHYAAAVARQMRLSEVMVEAMLFASPLHDLGKIGVPDSILCKPGELDALEWEIMKQHTIIGARILKNSDADFIRLGEVIALHHHEKWDGTGYPHGLKALDIPQCARIAAIADVFDALTSRRAYKEPFSVERSLSIIREGRGTHFDPEVVDAFLSIEDEILTIKRQHHEDDEQSEELSELKVLWGQYADRHLSGREVHING